MLPSSDHSRSSEDLRRSYLERLESRCRQGDGFHGDGGAAPVAARSPEPIDDRRATLAIRAIAALVEERILPPNFSILHVESGNGEVLRSIGSAFPEAQCYGVDWPHGELTPPGSPADSELRISRINITDLFQSRPEDRRERYDVVILSGRFEPAGAPLLLAKQADVWLEKHVQCVIGVATKDRVKELLERGMSVRLLEPARDGGQLICWSESALPIGSAPRGRRAAAGLSFLRWFWQNLRRHGLKDALYYAANVVCAVLDGRLSLAALGDQELRTRFCATLTPRRRVRAHTVYVFVFLGEFGFEVLNWQGVVRKFAARLPSSSKIVIGGRRGLQPFYESAAQYIEIDDIPEYRDSYAAAYFAIAPDEFRRYRPPTGRQFTYDRRLRRTVENYVRRALKVEGRRVEFVFSSELNAIDDCVFGVDPRFYGMDGYRGTIYAGLDLANNSFAHLHADDGARASVEAKLGFSLDEPYVLVQGRRRTIGPQVGRSLDTRALIAELAAEQRVVYLGFRSGRYLDSGSSEAGGAVTFYEAASFREQSCLISHARLCVFTTEGDLGSHTYLPPLLGRNVAVFASRDVFEFRSAPVDFWNRNVFRFGGQMIPWIAEELDSRDKIRAALDALRRTPDGASERAPVVQPPTKQIFFVMRHEGYVRNCEYIVEQLAERGHSLHIAIGARSGKSHDAEVLPQLMSRWPSITHRRLPPLSIRPWDDASGLARVLTDYLRYLGPEYEDAPRLHARATKQVPRTLLRLFESISAVRRPWALAAANALLRRVDRIAPSHLEAEEHLLTMKPDLVVFTPLLDGDFAALDYLKSAQALGIPTALCVASWDNLSSKGLIQIVPDRVIVWNDVQKEEAVQMHGIPPERILVTGAHLFDHWFEMRPSCSREEFCERRGLNPAEPFLLYVCSSGFVTENEVPFVRRWIEQIRAADSPLARAGILVRPHGANPAQWEKDDLRDLSNVSVWPPLGEGPTDDRSKQNYFDSLIHCAGVVGINTSALIEGGIAGKHVFTILADDFRQTQAGTLHFHYLVDGGLLTTAETLEEHVEQLDRVLLRGDAERDAARDVFIRNFIRPNGLDVASSPLAVRGLEELIEECPVARSARTRVGVFVARVLGRPLATMVHVYVRRRRNEALSSSEPPPGIALINRQRALAARAKQERKLPDELTAKGEATAARQEARAARRARRAVKREAKAAKRKAKAADRARKREVGMIKALRALAGRGEQASGKPPDALTAKQEATAAKQEVRAAKEAAKAAKQEARQAARAAEQQARAAEQQARAADRAKKREIGAIDELRVPADRGEQASGKPPDALTAKQEATAAKQEVRAAKEAAKAAKQEARQAARAAKREEKRQAENPRRNLAKEASKRPDLKAAGVGESPPHEE